jgi:hypothetical protein
MGVSKLGLHRIEAVPQRVGTVALGGDGSLGPISPGCSVGQQGHSLVGECDGGPAVDICGISTL